MKKNIVIVILVILLVASIGWGVFVQQQKTKLQAENQTLTQEKVALQTKNEKGLAYAKSLDLLMEPARQQAGLPTKKELTGEEFLLDLTEATQATADSELQSNLDSIKKGGDEASQATFLFMEHTASAIVEALE